MKNPLTIFALCSLLFALSATLFAQTTTGSSLITQMKAATHAFTLAGDLNPGSTGLESAPLVGKRTGDMLSAGEYNRILELVGQGGGGGGGSVKFHQANIPVSAGSVDLDSLLPSGYIAAFITSCGPSSNMDGLQIAYNTAVTTAGPNASCGAIMASPGVHIFGGGTWFKITGYLASGGGGGGGGTGVGGGGLGYGQTWQNMKGSAVGCAGPRISGTICTNDTGKPIQVNVSASSVAGQNVIAFYCYAGTGTDIFLGIAQRFWNGMGDSVGTVSFVVPVGGVYHCDMASNLPSSVTWSHWVELR